MNDPETVARPPNNATPLRIGDRYEVIEHIGAGGMGVVYKARHMFLDNIVAIKVLSTEKFDKEKYLRFDQEAKGPGSRIWLWNLWTASHGCFA